MGSRKIAGHGVIACARLSGLVVLVYARRLLIASNRHTAPHYFRCEGGTDYVIKNDRVQDASPAHGWHRPVLSLFFELKASPVQGWHRTTYSKMSTDKTSSVAAAALQPLEGVATPVQSMN